MPDAPRFTLQMNGRNPKGGVAIFVGSILIWGPGFPLRQRNGRQVLPEDCFLGDPGRRGFLADRIGWLCSVKLGTRGWLAQWIPVIIVGKQFI